LFWAGFGRVKGDGPGIDDEVTLEFRRVGKQDLAATSSFVKEAWRQAGPGAPGWSGTTQADIDEISSLPFLRELAKNPDEDFFIAKDGEKIVGMAVNKKVDESTLELTGIIVLRDHLGQGFGTGLAMMAEGAVVRRGAKRMIVMTEAKNLRALALYQSRGFVKVRTGSQMVGKVKVRLAWLTKEL
jgi:ribosomal protein S18 acetylase RimI-like enzyme